eukprot:m.337022 g.337022  ORF g.337022 m.337022 type:complete len:402 (+) comp18025_c0_seq1:122-1327(+)
MKKRLMQQAAAAMEQQENQANTGGSYNPRRPQKDEIYEQQAKLFSADLQNLLTNDIDLSYSPYTNTKTKKPTESPGGKKYKWSTSLDVQYKFDHDNARPREDISGIDWSKLEGVERSDAGAEGVYFVETDTGAIVLKGSRSIAPEAFSCLLGLKLGVLAPKFRVIDVAGDEGAAMMRNLGSLDISGRVNTTIKHQTHILIKSYIPGVTFGQLSSARAKEIFGPANKLSENGHERLKELGRLLALDVLCNNGDRFPLIWDNRGNPGNVMLAKGPGKIVSVDSQLMPIDKNNYPDEYQQYLDKVTALMNSVHKVRADPELECPEFKRVREKIAEYCGHDVGAQGTQSMQLGFLDVIDRRDSIALTKEVLEEWKVEFAKYTPALVGMHALEAQFVRDVWDRMHE